jgi:hypothetical protein
MDFDSWESSKYSAIFEFNNNLCEEGAMASKIILHAGFHKSGTTALQHSFDELKKVLSTHGVKYPLNQGRAHHRAAWGLTERTWGWKNNGGKKISRDFWNSLVQDTKKFKKRVLISSEFFTEAKDEHVALARRDFGVTPTQVIFTVRPFAKILASSYQQFVKYGIRMRYEPWLEEMFSKRGATTITPTFWDRVQVDQVVGRWAKEFGSENTVVILADEKRPDFIFSEFNQILDLPEGLLHQLPIGGNRSMTLEETELLYLINTIYDRSAGWEQYRALIRDGYVRYLADYTEANPKAERLATPQWAIDEARKLNHQHFENLRTLGVEIRGDLGNFVDAPVLAGNYEAPEKITIELAAKFLASYDYAVIRHIPRKVLLSEVKRRFRVSAKRYLKKFK